MSAIPILLGLAAVLADAGFKMFVSGLKGEGMRGG